MRRPYISKATWSGLSTEEFQLLDSVAISPIPVSVFGLSSDAFGEATTRSHPAAESEGAHLADLMRSMVDLGFARFASLDRFSKPWNSTERHDTTEAVLQALRTSASDSWPLDFVFMLTERGGLAWIDFLIGGDRWHPAYGQTLIESMFRDDRRPARTLARVLADQPRGVTFRLAACQHGIVTGIRRTGRGPRLEFLTSDFGPDLYWVAEQVRWKRRAPWSPTYWLTRPEGWSAIIEIPRGYALAWTSLFHLDDDPLLDR